MGWQRWIFALLALCGLSGVARADDQTLLARAMARAIEQFEAAAPRLPATLFGVDVSAYDQALRQQRFSGGAWDGLTEIAVERRRSDSGSCSRFAAFVRLPPEAGQVPLVLCPQFFTPDADALRVLTILHEMVHAVAGRDECQAMAFAARIEQLATGAFTPVTAYWQANGCVQGPYRLP